MFGPQGEVQGWSGPAGVGQGKRNAAKRGETGRQLHNLFFHIQYTVNRLYYRRQLHNLHTVNRLYYLS